MKIIFIGCVQFSYELLNVVYKHTDAEIVGIVSKESSTFNSDFKSLIPFAIEKNIPYLNYENKEQLNTWLKNFEYDVIYCFGWSYLLPFEIISSAKKGVFGYHPTALPKNRGRHPIIWTLVLGLEQTCSTFFQIDEGADSGDIVSQVVVDISPEDKAIDLYNKLTKVAKKQIIEITNKLIDDTLVRIPQNHSLANYWRKRTKEDGRIDWRMSSLAIYNLVRALSKPYVGAHCMYKNNEIKIWDVAIHKTNTNEIKHIEPGKILDVDINEKSFIVKTSDGAVKVLNHEFLNLPEQGEYLL